MNNIEKVKEQLKKMGFDYIDSDNKPEMKRELWQKGKLDIWIEFVEHENNL